MIKIEEGFGYTFHIIQPRTLSILNQDFPYSFFWRFFWDLSKNGKSILEKMEFPQISQKWIFHFLKKWKIHYFTKYGKSIVQKMDFPQMFGKWKLHSCTTNEKSISNSKMEYPFCLSVWRIHFSPQNGKSTFCSWKQRLHLCPRKESPSSEPQMENPSHWIRHHALHFMWNCLE